MLLNVIPRFCFQVGSAPEESVPNRGLLEKESEIGTPNVLLSFRVEQTQYSNVFLGWTRGGKNSAKWNPRNAPKSTVRTSPCQQSSGVLIKFPRFSPFPSSDDKVSVSNHRLDDIPSVIVSFTYWTRLMATFAVGALLPLSIFRGSWTS